MAVLTIKHGVNQAQDFIDHVSAPNNALYVFVGKPTEWSNEPTPDVANNDVNQFEQKIYHDIVFGKRIESTDAKSMIRRINWTSNTVYDEYNHLDGDLYTKNFFVITNENLVFKCIHNNEDAKSTIKPNLTTTSGTFKTTDGYIWKYMFTIDSDSMNRFATKDYIPVIANTIVEDNATPGSIDHINIVNGGTNYQIYEVGQVQRLANSQAIVISSDASENDNIYNLSSIYLSSGLGGNQIRKIKSYDGLNKIIIPYEKFDTFVNIKLSNISDTSEFLVGENISQDITKLNYVYYTGYFTEGDEIKQTDTDALGSLIIANSSVFQLFRSGDTEFNATGDYPVFNTATSGLETSKTGTASITAACTVITGVGTSFDTEYANDEFIRVGHANTNANIRRINEVTNSTQIIVSFAFANTLSANAHYKLADAFSIESKSILSSNGEIVYRNLDGVRLTYNNSITSSSDFVLGETIDMVDSANNNQYANGIISSIDANTIIVSDVSGVFQASNNTVDLYVKGKTSLSRAQIDDVEDYKNITIIADDRSLVNGQKIFSDGGANAVVESTFFIPNEQTQYIISPTVAITGDGSNALAYSVVNTGATSTNSVYQIVMIDPGSGYTNATITITSNSEFGNGASAEAFISPILGHGANAQIELGADRVGISTKIGTFSEEQYKILPYGDYRKIGIIRNPLYSTTSNPTLWLHLTDLDRVKLFIENRSDIFTTGETVLQTSSNATGTIVYSNSTYMELKNIVGSFDANTANDDITGLASGETANVIAANSSLFTASANSIFYQQVVDNNGLGVYGANGIITQVVSNTLIRVSDVAGRLQSSQQIIEPSTNAYATVEYIYTANNSQDITNNYGKWFNQTSRIGINSQTGNYILFEKVIQETSNASGIIINLTNELDFTLSSNTGAFIVGERIDNTTTSGNAVILFANSTYIKLSDVQGTFEAGDGFDGQSSGESGVVDEAFPVIVVNDIENRFQNGDNLIIGQTSNTQGTSALANTITYPDLVRESGDVIYIENIEPFEKTINSREDIRLIVKF